MQWYSLPFSELTTLQLYELIKLRIDIFVVEQNCPYPELDNKDYQPGVEHLLGYQDGKIVASVRLLPPGISFADAAIGRVVVHEDYRGTGLGVELMQQAVARCQQLWPEHDITISAQAHLEHFYGSIGFVKNSEGYEEDGIPHFRMHRPRDSQ